MTDEVHPGVRRVVAAARAAGLPITVERFPAGTRTATDAARAVGCEIGQIVKSLVFIADERPVVALISGADRLDPGKLAAVVGAATARRATGDEVRSAVGHAIGGVPPIGHGPGVRVVIDRGLLRHDVVWAAAGLPDAVFAASPSGLAAAAGALTADLAEDG